MVELLQEAGRQGIAAWAVAILIPGQRRGAARAAAPRHPGPAGRRFDEPRPGHDRANRLPRVAAAASRMTFSLRAEDRADELGLVGHERVIRPMLYSCSWQ